ncbi:alpha-amylase [Zafaria cholistanensis]|uniref:Alpha-amylase n=1 Tax=Zafaria cholistanensis TaxID=1682741 RepID=A0A5A7NTG0_9MICC|nr:alpha-amylase family protein [Zafaria cholistanensis]GER23442.1 alpha-amylase [Zafaria cholistanensis]
MRLTDTSDLWWKTAVIYCADVETFHDANGDGIGDLEGLGRRLDHLVELGVTCLWLMPFYPTPERDDGYDVVDFYGVDRRLGSLGDVVELVRTAKDRGLRVIADLVVNHTSSQHPWFLQAREDPKSPYHQYYVWREDKPPDTSGMVVFPGEQEAIWTRDRKAGKWYLHHFYRHQPDLNLSNPAVRTEIAKIAGFWLELGFDGFRVDGVPQLLSLGPPNKPKNDDVANPHEVLRDLRSFIGRRRGDAVLLGEVNMPYDGQRSLFGESGAAELDLIFDFVAMQYLYLSLARGDASALATALKNRPAIRREAQWAVFVRNHDELTLDQLTEAERGEVFAAFGPAPEHQVYGRGLRRRLPPMLDGDQQWLRMVYSLVFSLPGTPTLLYGEEIGMGENLAAPGRHAVRTPMQWSPDPGAGFSTANPKAFPAALVEGRFGPERVNVEECRSDPESLFNFLRHVIDVYRRHPELGWGELEILDQPLPCVLAHRAATGEASIVAVHNFSPEPVSTSVKLPGVQPGHELHDLISARWRPGPGAPQGSDPPLVVDGEGRVAVQLGARGFRWFGAPQAPGTRGSQADLPDLG